MVCKTWKPILFQHLPDKAKRNEFPLIFHAVNFGREQKEKSSPSWFNPHEVIEVFKWVEKLLPHSNKKPHIKAKNIGIITPYHQQVSSFMHQCMECTYMYIAARHNLYPCLYIHNFVISTLLYISTLLNIILK